MSAYRVHRRGLSAKRNRPALTAGALAALGRVIHQAADKTRQRLPSVTPLITPSGILLAKFTDVVRFTPESGHIKYHGDIGR